MTETKTCDRCEQPITGECWTWCNGCYYGYVPREIRDALAERDAVMERVAGVVEVLRVEADLWPKGHRQRSLLNRLADESEGSHE